MQPENEGTNFFVPTAAVDLDEFQDLAGDRRFSFVVGLELRVQGFVRQQTGLNFIEHGELRIEVEQTLVGEKFKFASGREGTIKEILTSGIASTGPIRIPATAAKPVMRIVLPDGKQVLRRCEG